MIKEEKKRTASIVALGGSTLPHHGTSPTGHCPGLREAALAPEEEEIGHRKLTRKVIKGKNAKSGSLVEERPAAGLPCVRVPPSPGWGGQAGGRELD